MVDKAVDTRTERVEGVVRYTEVDADRERTGVEPVRRSRRRIFSATLTALTTATSEGGIEAARYFPVVEERLRAVKQTVETGRVRVTSQVSTEMHPICGTVQAETVRVERVPVDRLVDEAP